MKTARQVCWFFIFSAGIFLGVAMAQQPSGNKEAGSITAIKCRALFKTNEKGPEVRLDPKVDKGRTLHVGERLKCLSDGTIKIVLYGTPQSIDKSLDWYPIPDTNSSNGGGSGTGGGSSGAGRPGEELSFAGTWLLDKSKSQGLSQRMQGADSVTWTITQNDKTIQIDQKVNGGQPPAGGGGGGAGGGGGRGLGGPTAPAVYNLDGTENNMEMGQGKASLKAIRSGGTLELVNKRIFNGPNGEVTTTNSQKLSLSGNGKILTAVVHNESPRGATDLTMVFIRQ